MNQLKDPNTVPPGGWKYRVPETGFTLSRNSRALLVQSVSEHLTANNIPSDPGTILSRIEAQICERAPASCYKVQHSPATPRPAGRRWSLREILNGVSAWLFDVKGENYAPMDVVRKRASVCANCPLRVESDACQECSKTYQAMVKRVGHSRIDPLRSFKLRICDACGCFQAVKVQLTLPTVMKRISPEQKAKLHHGCWILKELKETQK